MKRRCKEDRAMKITVELPDNTGTGFSNFVFGEVFGDAFGLSLGTISLDSERIKNREATYKSCLKNDTEPKEVEHE